MAEDLQQRPARPEHRNWRNWDFLSIGAFTAAAGFGLFAIANKIRESFWKNIIHGYGENETVFTDIVEKIHRHQGSAPRPRALGRARVPPTSSTSISSGTRPANGASREWTRKTPPP
ncbi:MAG: hypothetical protein WDN72_00825 [Alphaproteobacteria bacterium]